MKTIEIRTTQNVAIEYDLATLRDRGLGVALDIAIVLVAYGIFCLFLSALSERIFDLLPGHVWLIIFPIGAFLIYSTAMEVMNFGQTVGKSVVGTKVVRLDGKDPEWSDVLLRAILQLVDGLFSLAAIGAMLIKTTAKSQRLGDMAANTGVIKIQSSRNIFRLADIQNIQTLESYTPVFPQVRGLAERDLLFIKNVLSRQQQFRNEAHEQVVEDLVSHLMPILGLAERPANRVEFLKTLLRDYIVLTR